MGLIYEEVLREEWGVKTKVDVFGGLPHAFSGMLPQAGFTKVFRKKAAEAFKWLLEGK